MKCKRALEILEAIKIRSEIKINENELHELSQYELISTYMQNFPIEQLKKDLYELKKKYITFSKELRVIYKELLSTEGDFSNFSAINRFFANFRMSTGTDLKNKINLLKREFKLKESEINIIKNRILKLSSELEIVESAIKVNGKRIYLRPIGITIIDEIKVRKRYFDEELGNLMDLLNRLDQEFITILSNVKNLAKDYKIPPIWLLSLINLDLIELCSEIRSIFSQAYPSKIDISGNVEEEMFKILLSKLEKQYKNSKKMINLKKILDYAPFSSIQLKIFNEAEYINTILSLSKERDKYNYFLQHFKDLQEGANFFSAVASLFPWEPEETWMILLRAESNILKAQSAQFIPELIEYAILLIINPKILTIENDISQQFLKNWHFLIIPIIHLGIYSIIDKKIENAIKRRPLSYITSPRYYRRSFLHYHVIG